MSRTIRKGKLHNKYAKWIYKNIFRQKINCNDYEDDNIISESQKVTLDDKPIYTNYKIIMSILESYVGNTFNNFQQHMQKTSYFEESKKYINYKANMINNKHYYVNDNNVICKF